MSMGRAPAFTPYIGKSSKAPKFGSKELWVMPAKGFLQGRAIVGQRGLKGRGGFRQRGTGNGLRAFAKKEGNVSEEVRNFR